MRYLHVAMMTALVALGAACTADNEPAGREICENMQMSVATGGMSVNRGGTRGYTSSAAINGYTFTSGQKVKIAVTGVSGSSRSTTAEETKAYAVSNTSTGQLGISSAPFFWMNTAENISVRAWSYGTTDTPADIPTTGANAGKLDFTIRTDQSAATDDYELLYGPAASYGYSTHRAGFGIDLYHQLARVIINLKRDNTSDAISSVTIGDGTTANLPTTGTFTVPTTGNVGTWASQTTNVSTITPRAITPAVSGYEYTYTAILMPGTYAQGTKLIKIVTAQGSLYYTLASALTMAPGQQYTFNVGVRNQQITVTSTVSNWGSTVADATPQGNLPIDIRRNPLWWVAQYNLAEGKTSFVTEHSTTSQYVFKRDDVITASVQGYHIPLRSTLSEI